MAHIAAADEQKPGRHHAPLSDHHAPGMSEIDARVNARAARIAAAAGRSPGSSRHAYCLPECAVAKKWNNS